MAQKKIFIISTEFPPGPGGIGSHAWQLAKELHKLNWDVKVFSEQAWEAEPVIEEFNRSSIFKIFRLHPTPSVFSLVIKFLKLVYAAILYRPDIILGTGKHGAWFAFLVGKLTFRKTAAVGHGTEFIITMSDRSRKFNNYVYSSIDVIIYVSAYTQKIAEEAGIKNKHAFIIHNGADDELFYRLSENEIKAFKEKKGLADKKVIITVGNVQVRKGHEWVIRSMPEIVKQIPSAHYYCVGQTTIKSKLEPIIEELGIKGHVHFTGTVPIADLRAWLNAADVFAMTSIATDYGDVEGFGIAVVEAALCGTPAVVTGESGPGEAIIENESGFGVNERDTKNIAERITRLLSNEPLRKKMGNTAMGQAVTARTWTIAVKKYDEALSSALS